MNDLKLSALAAPAGLDKKSIIPSRIVRSHPPVYTPSFLFLSDTHILPVRLRRVFSSFLSSPPWQRMHVHGLQISSVFCALDCVLSLFFNTIAPCIKACLKAFHTGCHVALSDSLSDKAEAERRGRRGARRRYDVRKKGGEKSQELEARAIPSAKATSASSGADQMQGEQIERRWVKDRGMEKKEWKRLCEPTAAGWNF